MRWYEVVIPKNNVANENAAGLMNRCGRALLESGTPRRSIQAYHGAITQWSGHLEPPPFRMANENRNEQPSLAPQCLE
jgi:hypothetical protein